MKATSCSRCRAMIFWAKTASGKNIPLDYRPNEAGNMYVFEETAHALRKGEIPPNRLKRYMPHYATCARRR